MNCNTTHYRANSSSVPGDPTYATLRGQQAADFFDDSKIVDARLASGHYTWTKIRHTKSVRLFDGGIVCWANQNGANYRGYEHGLFMGHSPASGCHMVNDTNAIQMKAHYGGANGTQWYIPNACGTGRGGHSMLGTCQPLQVTYSAIYIWVR